MDMECIWSHMFYLLRCSLAFCDAAIGYFFFISSHPWWLLVIAETMRLEFSRLLSTLTLHCKQKMCSCQTKVYLFGPTTPHFTTQQSPPWHERHQQNIFASMSKAWGNEDFNKKKNNLRKPVCSDFPPCANYSRYSCLSVCLASVGQTEYKCEKRSVKWKQQTKKTEV